MSRPTLRLAVTLLASTLLLTACCSTPCPDSAQQQPDGRYTAAILAASKVGFSSDRCAALIQVARQPDLQECDQLRIVSAIAAHSGYSSDNRDVLLALLANPSTTDATRRAIAERLDSLVGFSSDRAEVAKALARRSGRGFAAAMHPGS